MDRTREGNCLCCVVIFFNYYFKGRKTTLIKLIFLPFYVLYKSITLHYFEIKKSHNIRQFLFI